MVAWRAGPGLLALGIQRQGELVQWGMGLVDAILAPTKVGNEALGPRVEHSHVLLRGPLIRVGRGAHPSGAQLLEPPVEVLRSLVEVGVRRRAQPAHAVVDVLQEIVRQAGILEALPELRSVVRERALAVGRAHHDHRGLLGQVGKGVVVHGHAPHFAGAPVADLALVLLLQLPGSPRGRATLAPEQNQHPSGGEVLLLLQQAARRTPCQLPWRARRTRGAAAGAVGVVGVQELVGLVAAGLLEELRINLRNCRVLVALAQGHLAVQIVNRLHTLLQHHGVVAPGLSPAADAPRGAGHHLHEVELLLAVLDPLHHLLDVLAPVGDANVQSGLAHLDRSLLDPVKPAAALELQLGQGLARLDLVRRAQRGLHHPPGHPKQGGRPAGLPKGVVVLRLGNLVPVNDAALAKQPGELPGG
eukprot:RCo046702